MTKSSKSKNTNGDEGEGTSARHKRSEVTRNFGHETGSRRNRSRSTSGQSSEKGKRPGSARANRSSGSRGRRLLRRPVMYVIIAILGVLAAVFFCLFISASLDATAAKNRLEIELRIRKKAVKSLDETVAELRDKIGEMANGQLPPTLKPLDFDKVIFLDSDIHHNVLFTRVGTPEAPSYEYRVTLNNVTAEPINPQLTLLLFNEDGIQIGQADIQDSEDWQKFEGQGLGPGERSSISGNVVLTVDAIPSFFAMKLDSLESPETLE